MTSITKKHKKIPNKRAYQKAFAFLLLLGSFWAVYDLYQIGTFTNNGSTLMFNSQSGLPREELRKHLIIDLTVLTAAILYACVTAANFLCRLHDGEID